MISRSLGVAARFVAITAAISAAITAVPALAQDEGVPFITTPDHVTTVMLELAAVKAGDYVIDLGSGDGRIVITAAKSFEARGLGVEIVPDLVLRSQDNARKAGVADRAEFRVQDLFKTDLSAASVITMYLLPEVNLQLRPRILALKPGTRIVSHDWDMGDWQPDRTRVVDVPDKKVGREKLSRIHLWIVPARVHGLWCGQGAHAGWQLRFNQRHQFASGQTSAPAVALAPMQSPPAKPEAARELSVRVLGAELFTNDGLALRWESADGSSSGPSATQTSTQASTPAFTQTAPSGRTAPNLQVTRTLGHWSALTGAQFSAAVAARCPS